MAVMKTIDCRVPEPPAATTLDDHVILTRGRSVLRSEAAAIQEMESLLNDQFVRAVRSILACKGRICVTGVGKAGQIGNKIQSTLASTGTLSYTLHPVEALHGDLGMIHGDDCVIALSKSGSSELVELLPRLKQMGCLLILITARTDSVAAKIADIVLDIGRTEEACPLGLAPSSSTAAMLAMGDALALTVMELKAVRPEQYAAYHPGGSLGRLLMTCREIMRTGADCPRVPDSATLTQCFEVILAAPKRAGAACIVNEADVLVGIITQGDFLRLFSRKKPVADALVRGVMTPNPRRMDHSQRVTSALELMRKHAIDELPVVDEDGRLVGLIDIQDLISRGFSVFDSA